MNERTMTIPVPLHFLPLTDEQAKRVNRWIDRRLKLEGILTSRKALNLIASRYYVWADLLEADGRATWLNYEEICGACEDVGVIHNCGL